MASRPEYDPKAGVVYARPLWLDTAFRVAFGPVAGWSFLGKTLRLTLTHIDTGTRFSFTQADFTLSDSNTVARLVKDAAWVSENVQPGWHECHFWVDGQADHWAAFVFEAIVPAGTRVSP